MCTFERKKKRVGEFSNILHNFQTELKKYHLTKSTHVLVINYTANTIRNRMIGKNYK